MTPTLIETLELILLQPDDEIVRSNMEELEGDFHTFLHDDNINKLSNINQSQKKMIREIRKIVSDIPKSEWNIKSFRIGNKWKEARQLTNVLLSEL